MRPREKRKNDRLGYQDDNPKGGADVINVTRLSSDGGRGVARRNNLLLGPEGSSGARLRNMVPLRLEGLGLGNVPGLGNV